MARATSSEIRRGEQSYYIARSRSGGGKGVLVLHAWWGLTPFFTGLCERLAYEGFTALAPDLYGSVTASTIAGAKLLRSKLKQTAVALQVAQAAQALHAACGGGESAIGVLGLSLGGYWGLWLAEQPRSAVPDAHTEEKPPQVAATVAFYATRNGDYSASASAFQFHLAERDDYVATSGVKKLQKSLQASGREAEFHTYPGTTHWFFESDRPDAYNAPAAALAWKRTVEFLNLHLKRAQVPAAT